MIKIVIVSFKKKQENGIFYDINKYVYTGRRQRTKPYEYIGTVYTHKEEGMHTYTYIHTSYITNSTFLLLVLLLKT